MMSSRICCKLIQVLFYISWLIGPNCGQECDTEYCSEENDFITERFKRSTFVPYRTGATIAKEVSSTLDELLLYSGYDKRIRPQVGQKYSAQNIVSLQNFKLQMEL